MRRVILGLAVALGVVAWAVARPGDKPGETVPPDDTHSEIAAEYRFHTNANTHWRQVALRR